MDESLVRVWPVVARGADVHAAARLTRAQALKHIKRSDPKDPLYQYLISLRSQQSRLTMLAALDRAVRAMGGAYAEQITWGNLRHYHVTQIIENLRELNRSPLTINLTLSALQGVARQAFILEQLGDREYLRIKEVKREKSRRKPRGRALPFVELVRLLDSCAEDKNQIVAARDAAMIALFARAGMRRAEVISVGVDDYDGVSHCLRVRGKGDSDRYVHFLDGGSRRAILAWLKVRGLVGNKLLCPLDRWGRIMRNRPLSPKGIYEALKSRAKKAGVAHFSPHDLRRTFATELLEGGGDLLAVQHLMGHAHSETTSTYDLRHEGMKREALKLLKKFPYRQPRRLAGNRRRKGKRRRHRS